MANGVKKIAIFVIMGAFLLFSLAGCSKASAAKGSSSSSSSSKTTASSTKKSSSEKSSSKSSSSTTKSSVVASSSSVAASSSNVAASSSAAPSSSAAATPATTGMNIAQIISGDFSSIVGTWTNDIGNTITITSTNIFSPNLFSGSSYIPPVSINIGSGHTVVSSSDPTAIGVKLNPSNILAGNGDAYSGTTSSIGAYNIEIGFYPINAAFPQSISGGWSMPYNRENILLYGGTGSPSENNFYHR